MPDVKYYGRRGDILRIANQVAAILAGKEEDKHGIARSFFLSLGFAVLSDVKQAYIIKSEGGTDDMGIKWPKLSKAYLAYGQRRFGRGEQAELKRRAGLGPGHRRAPGGKKGLLNAAQLKQWRYLYRTHLSKFSLSEPEGQAKSHAAAVAWVIMKRRGAQTKLEVFGTREVKILRDTQRLFNSLSPGLLSGEADTTEYQKPTQLGGDQQIMDVLPGLLTVGTNVEYAGAHQDGLRPFLPDEKHPIPAIWWQRWLEFAIKALVVSVAVFYQRESNR